MVQYDNVTVRKWVNVLRLPYHEGAEYRDIWNDKELNVTVKDGFVYLATDITAQAVGAIVENKRKNCHD